MVQQGIDAVLSINGIVVGGQQNIQLKRTQSAIDITNKIDGRWKESIGGLKGWGCVCNGIYIINSNSFQLLEDCYMQNQEIEVEIITQSKSYHGKALIVDFPVQVAFNNTFKYRVELLGTGELQ